MNINDISYKALQRLHFTVRMKRLTGTNKEIAELLYQEQLELSKENRDVERTIQAIIEDVKERGDEALRDYSAKFDKVDLTDIEVGQDLIDKAFKEIDPEVYQALDRKSVV